MKTASSEIVSRLVNLRKVMQEKNVDLYLITSSDYHASEYVGDFFKVSEYFSACTSDNVVMVVDQTSAKLWTDGRYFISAANELDGTGVDLMKMGEPGVPTVSAYLEEKLKDSMTLGFDGRTVTAAAGKAYRSLAEKKGAAVDSSFAPADIIWTDRPGMPQHPVFVLGEEIVGESVESKLTSVREDMKKAGANTLVISSLDDIMWLLNIRGGDVECNPVALSYTALTMDACHLFVQKEETTEDLRAHAEKCGISLHEYSEIFSWIETCAFDGKVMLDTGSTSDTMLHAVEDRVGSEGIVFESNPTQIRKAIKNETEMEKSREAYLLDSVAVTRFIYWVKKNVGKIPMTEVSAADYLEKLRREIPGFFDLSFGTISAYNANAAMAHYAPDAENCAEVKPEGFLLVDSGGQYMGGTTDVTRTIALGDLTEEMIHDFTVVAISNLRLLYAQFQYGCTGLNLDMYARAPFWDEGTDFNHGTGHGIGYILNVHEGPQNINWRNRRGGEPTVFEPGMITSDEPGMYKEGKFGIRTETIIECVEAGTTPYGRFLKFEPLTWAPIDLDAIDKELMDKSDIRKLNDYHRRVFEKVSPYLEGEELEWLREATREI